MTNKQKDLVIGFIAGFVCLLLGRLLSKYYPEIKSSIISFFANNIEVALYIFLFLLFDIVFLLYLSKKYNAKPWQLNKLFKAWYREYGGS